MEFVLIVLISYGSDNYSAIELERYRSHVDCQFEARSMSNHSPNTARIYINGEESRVLPAYVCVPAPK